MRMFANLKLNLNVAMPIRFPTWFRNYIGTEIVFFFKEGTNLSRSSQFQSGVLQQCCIFISKTFIYIYICNRS